MMEKITQHPTTSKTPTTISDELEVDNMSAEKSEELDNVSTDELSKELDNVSGGHAPRSRYMDPKPRKVR
jgi:hypothetical protein